MLPPLLRSPTGASAARPLHTPGTPGLPVPGMLAGPLHTT